MCAHREAVQAVSRDFFLKLGGGWVDLEQEKRNGFDKRISVGGYDWTLIA